MRYKYECINKILTNGIEIRDVADILGHRNVETTENYYIEERKYEDICQIMNMNYQSVRNLMHRGLSKLKTIAG